MIKYWQSMQDYKYFLNESKVHFDSSERNRLHTELWKPWQKLRLFTDVPRGTDAYKKIYTQRTATERINNRILNNYGLCRMFIHTKEHYSFMTTMIGICIHLDARLKKRQKLATA